MRAVSDLAASRKRGFSLLPDDPDEDRHGPAAEESPAEVLDRWSARLGRRTGQAAFDARLTEFLAPGQVVLELGDAAPRSIPQRLRQRMGLHVFALDRSAMEPPPSRAIGLHEGSVDLLVSRNLLCRVENPLAFFRVTQRWLKPGGRMLHLSPNGNALLGAALRLIPFDALASRRARALTSPAQTRLLLHALGFEEIEVIPCWAPARPRKRSLPLHAATVAGQLAAQRLDVESLCESFVFSARR